MGGQSSPTTPLFPGLLGPFWAATGGFPEEDGTPLPHLFLSRGPGAGAVANAGPLRRGGPLAPAWRVA
jgi:hypothetical protein